MGLDTVELVIATEKHFKIDIPDSRAATTETVEQLAQLICDLKTHAENPIPYPWVLLQLQQLIAKLFGIPLNRIVPTAHFVKDLGLD